MITPGNIAWLLDNKDAEIDEHLENGIRLHACHSGVWDMILVRLINSRDVVEFGEHIEKNAFVVWAYLDALQRRAILEILSEP